MRSSSTPAALLTARGTRNYRVVKPADSDHIVGVSPTRSLTTG